MIEQAITQARPRIADHAPDTVGGKVHLRATLEI